LRLELSEFSGNRPGTDRFRSGNIKRSNTVSVDFFESNREVLEQALQAAAERGYWSPFPESPSPRVYGETAADDGRKAFESLLNQDFPLDLPGSDGKIGRERSPFGIDLNIRYPRVPVQTLLAQAGSALKSWRDAGPKAWVG